MMINRDSRIDEYIEQAPAFAQPILIHIREIVHKASPLISESIKWGIPTFECNGLLCSMAAFKKHCAFTFYKASLMPDKHQILIRVGKTAMGQFGKIQTVSDLPPESVLVEYVGDAVKINESGGKVNSQTDPKITKEVEMPLVFDEALQKNRLAFDNFQAFSFSQRKEYITWINEAKTEATRQKRLDTAIQWIEEGKGKNWKYKK